MAEPSGCILPAGIGTNPSPQQIRDICRLRYRVYVDEMKKPYPGADHVRRELGDQSDALADHLFLHEAGTIVGAVRLTPFPRWKTELRENQVPEVVFRHYAEGTSLVSRLVIDPLHRAPRRAIVSLMLGAYLLGSHRRIRYGVCHSRPGLAPFFKRFGWRVCGPEFFHDSSASPQVPLVFDAFDRAYLTQIGSPFAAVFEEP